MIALVIFSFLAAAAVWVAGRKDPALDPRLTTVALLLLGIFPVLLVVLPKWISLPGSKVGDPGVITGWKVGLVGIWIAGFLLEFVRLLIAWWRLGSWRRKSHLLEMVDGVEIRSVSGIGGPVAVGVLTKVIFVPAEWSSWEQELKTMVLRHELAHHERRDPLRRWIAGMAIAVNWFNPLARWMVRRLLIQCEFSCDAEVIRSGVDMRRYARALCDLAEDRPLSGGALAMAERSSLEARVRRMVEPQHRGGDLGSGWLILFAVAAAGLLALAGEKQIAAYTEREIDLRRTADPFPGR